VFFFPHITIFIQGREIMAEILTFFCTRPTLAEILIRKGFEAETTTNPWSPERTAWRFHITHELADNVRKYYGGLGKPLPPSTTRIFEALGV
jgi:hypothetical protein